MLCDTKYVYCRHGHDHVSLFREADVVYSHERYNA